MWVVTRFAMEESSQTLLIAIVFLIALTVGLAVPLVLLTVRDGSGVVAFLFDGRDGGGWGSSSGAPSSSARSVS